MARNISRRAFIRSLSVSVVSMAIGGCAEWDRDAQTNAPADPEQRDQAAALAFEHLAATNPQAASIIALLRQQFAYLNLDMAGLLAFAKDFQAKAGKKVLAQQESDPGAFEYTVGTQFLMSTDFFRNGADETRLVKYTVYYDLYTGCTSPFARFD